MDRHGRTNILVASAALKYVAQPIKLWLRNNTWCNCSSSNKHL